MNGNGGSSFIVAPPPQSSTSGRVIAFASAKGGTGKTVLAASTALVLIRSGKRVLIIDGDFSTRGLSLFILGSILHTSDLVVREEECLADFFLSEVPLEDLRPRLIDRGGIEYHILFSNKTLWHSGVPEHAILSDLKLEPARYVAGLKRIFEHFRQKYDYIIVDTRGGYDFTSAAPALLSDSYIIVLEPDRVSLEQVQGYEKAITEFADNHSLRIPLRGFVVNKASFDPNETRFVEELTRTYSIKTYGVVPADLSCIRAYETTDSPILRFPYSDFSYWSIRAIERFVAPGVNWTNKEDVQRFEKLRKEIGEEWAGRKRTDKLLSWLPFAQLLPIGAACLFYIIFRFSPSTFALLATYAAVVLFIVWSMIGATFYGLGWLRSREVSASTRKQVAGIVGAAIAASTLLMVFDVPRHIFLLTLPPVALEVGESAERNASVMQDQALQLADAWERLASEFIDLSERRIREQVEISVRKNPDIGALDPLPAAGERLVSLLTRQISDTARDRIRRFSAEITSAVHAQGDQTKEAMQAIIWILRNPRASVDARVDVLRRALPADLKFPAVSEILKTATESILDPSRDPILRPDTDPPRRPR